MSPDGMEYALEGEIRLEGPVPAPEVAVILQEAHLFYLACVRGETFMTQEQIADYAKSINDADDSILGTRLPIFTMNEALKMRVLGSVGSIYIEYMSRFYTGFKQAMFGSSVEDAPNMDHSAVLFERLKRFSAQIVKERSMNEFDSGLKTINASKLKFCDESDRHLTEEALPYLHSKYHGVMCYIDDTFSFFVGVDPDSMRTLVVLEDKTGRIKMRTSSQDIYSSFCNNNLSKPQFAFMLEQHLNSLDFEIV